MSNKLKSETIFRYPHLPDEEIDLDQEFQTRQSYREFDISGNLVVEMAYTQQGELADKTEYRYDDSGRLAETLIYGEDDEVLERREAERDNDGRLEREIIYYLDGSADTHEYVYDEKGNLIEMKVVDDDDEPESSEKYFYEDDHLVKVERLNEFNKVVFRQEDTYENGKISSRKIWSSEEGEPYTIVNKFNEAGLREQELRYNSRDQLIERNIFEEDEHGHVTRIIEENRQRKNITDITFDEQGNVIHQVETDMNGDLNHEIFRTYNTDGQLILTTVETVMKTTGATMAYSLIYKRETFGE
jgi:YD repeat-containing protein